MHLRRALPAAAYATLSSSHMQAQWEHGERLQGQKNGRTLQTAVQCGMGRIEGSRGVRQNKEDERQHAGAELFENKKGKG